VIGDRAADDSAGPLHTRLRALLGALSGMVGDRVLLFSLELQLAGKAFALILILLAGAAVAALTAWIALWLALAAWIMHNGWGWGWAALSSLRSTPRARPSACSRRARSSSC
jgi:uncharacterized membrane protein YqjE